MQENVPRCIRIRFGCFKLTTRYLTTNIASPRMKLFDGALACFSLVRIDWIFKQCFVIVIKKFVAINLTTGHGSDIKVSVQWSNSC